MATRDLLLLIGVLRSGKMFPVAVPWRGLQPTTPLDAIQETMAEQERAIFPDASRASARADLGKRSAITGWSGVLLAPGMRVADVPDPGVLLCLLYDVPTWDAPLPVEVFAQTLRRYAIRDPLLRAKFDEHVDQSGSYLPDDLPPELRRQRSKEAFDAAMKVAREQGFALAAPLFEGVRGDSFAPAQIAIAIHELRDLGDNDSALRRLTEVVRVAPRNIAARMARARALLADPGRKIEAAIDYLAVLREVARPDAAEHADEVRVSAVEALWALHHEYADPAALGAALALARDDEDRGFEALSRYVHMHPCAWDAQAHLASLALSRQRFDLTVKLLGNARWLFPDDPNPHFVYGQALASKGNLDAAFMAMERAARLAPGDADIQKWLRFVRKKLANEQGQRIRAVSGSVSVADHVARSLLVLLGMLRDGRVYPSARLLHKLPGDVSLAFALQGAAAQEQQRFSQNPAGTLPATSGELRALAERSVILSYAGEPLSADLTVGDVADPGVLLVLVYPEASRVSGEMRAFNPPPAEARQSLLGQVHQDAELASKLDRHLRSTDATLKTRLDLEG
jgi:tetratricopeptide (TPR) repeat protein